jgi:hypothetical protein
MHRLALLLVLAAACGAKNKGDGTAAGTGDGTGTGDPGVVKQVILGFGTEPVGMPDADPPKTRVWLTVTDETGAAKSYPMGEVAATCSAEPGGDMGAYGTLRCWYAGGGANFIVVGRGGELILLRQETDEGLEEPADYEELSRVSVPTGAAVTFQP